VNTLLDGRYQILKKLGHGGFAHTYLARNISLPDRPVCVIKHLRPRVFHPSVLQLFRREARVLDKLDHQQIPNSTECFERDGEVFMVQDFIAGEDLGKQYLRGRCWSETEIRQLLVDILEVLTYVHQRHIVHRDIKPENIIQRQADGQYVLIDFGAVQELDTLDEEEEDERGTPILGTAGYRSPEQLRGESACNSDLYGLGVTAIQLLTRIHPSYLPQRYGQLVWQEQATISPELGAVIDKMVCTDLADRYASTTDVLLDLQNLPKPILQPDPPETTSQSSTRSPLFLAAIGILSLGAVLGVTLHFNQSTPPAQERSALQVSLNH
jgi:eukaryotic-like serine/threonine-protein kinase